MVRDEVVLQREVMDRDEAVVVGGHEEDHEVVLEEAVVDTDPIYIQVEVAAL